MGSTRFDGGFGSSLVLDGERGELVMRRGERKKEGVGGLDLKAAIALKSHSEAERRRRERINGHLAMLRGMLPCSDKLDKAALLAEVISHVKKLKANAVEISKHCFIPSDGDEVRVEVDGDESNNARGFTVKASLCCEDRPDLLSDLKQTLQSLKMKTLRVEISTLGGRLQTVLVISCDGHLNDMERHLFTTNVHQALKSVLDRGRFTRVCSKDWFSKQKAKDISV